MIGSYGRPVSDDEYTPTTGQLRHAWCHFPPPAGEPVARTVSDRRAAEFERWLAAHDAEVREEVALKVEAVTLDGLAMHANTARAVVRHMARVVRGGQR